MSARYKISMHEGFYGNRAIRMSWRRRGITKGTRKASMLWVTFVPHEKGIYYCPSEERAATMRLSRARKIRQGMIQGHTNPRCLRIIKVT